MPNCAMSMPLGNARYSARSGPGAHTDLLCSTLGVGCRAMQVGLSGAEDGPAGLAACGPGQRRLSISVIVSMTDSKATTAGGGPPRAANPRGFCSMGLAVRNEARWM